MMEINYVAVLLAGVVSMVVGFLWYGPLFGKPWMKEKGITPESMKTSQSELGQLYGMSFVLSLITAFVLTHVMTLSEYFYHYAPLTTGLNTAFWMWLGFIMPVQMTATLFGNKNWKLFGIDTGYQLAFVLAMAVVIALLW